MNFECITPFEANRMYNHAENPVEMIGILADLLDATYYDVCQLLGIIPVDDEPKFDKEKIARMIESGMKGEDIAAELGVSVVQCHGILKGLGVNLAPLKSKSQWPELYEKGFSDAEIARMTFWSKTSVMTWRKENNLPPNQRRKSA